MRLMMWTGGPDSTHALIRLLRETNDKITAINFYFINTNEEESAMFGEEPSFMEKQCSNLQKLKGILEERYREFELEIITVRRSHHGINAENIVIPMVFALQEPNSILHDARCAEDNDYGYYTKEYDGRGVTRDRQELYGDIVDIQTMGLNIPKRQICRELGDIWPLTWSCGYPTPEGLPCNNCQKCHDRKRAEENLPAIEISRG